MDETTISEAERTLGFLLRVPYDALSARVYGGLAEAGFPEIRPAHSSVFRHIAAGGSRVSDLAERAHMTKQSMAYLVESLAAAGYVAIAPDPADGRAKRVTLTPRGREVWHTLVARSRAAEAEFASRLPPGRMQALRSLLGELADTLAATPR